MNDQPARMGVRVLVVDDSPVLREFIVHLLEAYPGIVVIGTAANGREAVAAVKSLKPDVVTMDYHMPTMNGLEATRQIMETCPVPIVIVSGSSMPDDGMAAFQLLEAGALAVVEKPPGFGRPSQAAAAHLAQTVKLMAEVKVVRRWPRPESERFTNPAPIRAPYPRIQPGPKLVAIGASTGGPVALHTILSALPKNFPVPVLIVQHIAPGFTQGLAEWLAESTGFPVQLAVRGAAVRPGHAYVAPEGHQMKLSADGRIVLSEDATENGHRPSVSYLFRSIAAGWGRHAIGVLLTGMGKDGADELKLMREQGAITIAQDFESSVIHGMPGEAIALDAATHVLAPDEIGAVLGTLAQVIPRSP